MRGGNGGSPAGVGAFRICVIPFEPTTTLGYQGQRTVLVRQAANDAILGFWRRLCERLRSESTSQMKP